MKTEQALELFKHFSEKLKAGEIGLVEVVTGAELRWAIAVVNFDAARDPMLTFGPLAILVESGQECVLVPEAKCCISPRIMAEIKGKAVEDIKPEGLVM